MRTLMTHTKQAWWLNLSGSIIGFDDDGQPAGGGAQGGSGTEGGAPNAGAGTAQGQPGEGQEPESGSGQDEGAGEDTSGLKSALQKEREERKNLEKELKSLRKDKQTREDAEKSEIDRLKSQSQRDAEKATKLAAGFRANAVETAILKAAGNAKFRDPSDALRAEVISAVGVEQDEDDPSNVTIDEATVTEAIKQLAKNKPHYVSTGDGRQLPKSGSSFAGGTQPKGDAAKAELQKKYPALRGL